MGMGQLLEMQPAPDACTNGAATPGRCPPLPQDYLNELDDPMSTIYGESSIDKAMTVACATCLGGAGGAGQRLLVLTGAAGGAALLPGTMLPLLPLTPRPDRTHTPRADNNTRDWLMSTFDLKEE